MRTPEAPTPTGRSRQVSMRVTSNILAEDLQQPSCAQLPAKFIGRASAASTRDVYDEAAERKEH